jgi:ribosomal protein S18 acetylase RimI-like enzyme
MSAPDHGVEVSALRAGEEAAVIGLWRAAGLTRPWNDPAEDIAFCRESGHGEVMVLREDGTITGACMVGHDGHRGVVYYLAVAGDGRRAGRGRRLMRAAEDWLKERGVWKLNLLVRKGNEAVIDFYAALGFEDQGSICLGKWLDPARAARQRGTGWRPG